MRELLVLELQLFDNPGRFLEVLFQHYYLVLVLLIKLVFGDYLLLVDVDVLKEDLGKFEFTEHGLV